MISKELKKTFSCFIKVIFYLKTEYNVCQIRCFKNGFQSLQWLHPRRLYQVFALESMVEGSLSAVIPRPSTE